MYHGPNLFPQGTVHHAVEIGSVKDIVAVAAQQKQLRGYPALVVLEQRDDLLQVPSCLQFPPSGQYKHEERASLSSFALCAVRAPACGCREGPPGGSAGEQHANTTQHSGGRTVY